MTLYETIKPAASFECLPRTAVTGVGLSVLCALALAVPSRAQVTEQSGGPLHPGQAAYDVVFYDLNLRFDPEGETLEGWNSVHAIALRPLDALLLDLDPRYTVDSVLVTGPGGRPARTVAQRLDSRLSIELGFRAESGERIVATLFYRGRPRTAQNPPWDGGFVWQRTGSGDPWFSVCCQNEGADLWWPCKDHPSDEPDSAALHFTVPEPLIAVSNGRLLAVERADPGSRTFHWFVSLSLIHI